MKWSVRCSVMFDSLQPHELPGSSVPGILHARILEWVAIPFFKESSRSRDWTWVSCIRGRLFTTEPPGKPKIIKYLFKHSIIFVVMNSRDTDWTCWLCFQKHLYYQTSWNYFNYVSRGSVATVKKHFQNE